MVKTQQRQKRLRRDNKNTQSDAKKDLNYLDNHLDHPDHSPRTRHPGVESQVVLQKHCYKVRGGDGILTELFKILKDDAVKVLHSLGEGHGNPLQYSCLENPTDRGAWQVTVHRVLYSQTDLFFIFFTYLSFVCCLLNSGSFYLVESLALSYDVFYYFFFSLLMIFQP